MKKFNYRFESILKFKENLKKHAMKEVAEVEREISACNEKKIMLINELRECNVRSTGKKVKASDLQFLESHIYYLKKKIEIVDNELSKLRLLSKMKVKKLKEKTIENKIFDKLKESDLVKFVKDQNKIDLKNNDEFAIQKSNRE
ncbi:MAG: flagellar FliJ family protein [Melioribacteraceae bacterium]|nr:flagellar FliJ family protein [Melioribacteraceae bacterium]